MNKEAIEKKFEKMGAKAVVLPPAFGRFGRTQVRSTVNILTDKQRGEHFVLQVVPEEEVVVLNVDAGMRHLLLNIKDGEGTNRKILCGHDERHWFAAGVSNEGVGTVRDAIESLKPADAHNAQVEKKVRKKNRNKRKNKGFKRQGEFFFIRDDVVVDEAAVLKNEPLRMSGRSGGKPHMAQYIYREGGRMMYTISPGWATVSEAEYRARLKVDPKVRVIRTERANATVYAKGTIRHADHKTITLDGWHRVVVNGEIRGKGVLFLD